MQLYHLPVSLYSFKVRLALALMGVELQMAEPHGGTYRSAAYRALVPPGTIPALVGDGLVAHDLSRLVDDLVLFFREPVRVERPVERDDVPRELRPVRRRRRHRFARGPRAQLRVEIQ